MAGGIGKKVEGAAKRAVKGKATGGRTAGTKGGAGKKGKGGGASKVERAAREILK